jgi:NADH dehydrogenase
VVLFNRDNHMVFVPLLPDVAGSSLNPRAVAPPLRALLPGARCRTEEVTSIDPVARRVVFEGHDGAPRELSYDHLVVACGSVVNLNLLPGMANHALPLKTIGDAIAMRAHVMQMLEKADAAEAPEDRRRYLSFVVVGGGFSGVEVAGELNDLLRSALTRYPRIARSDATVTLLHGQAEILPEVSPSLRRFAHRRMERRGIVVRCSAEVREVTARGARLAGGERFDGGTVICTVGTTANPLVAKLDLAKERGRIAVAPDLSVPGHAGMWAIGDCAYAINAHDGRPAPPTAQFGERQGTQCARNILRVLDGQATRPFRYRPAGVACGIGGHSGVAELYGVRFSGFVAWWLWRSAFLVKIPSLAQKIKVGLDWAWELAFPRDLSHFRPARSEPVSQAHYAAGDVVATATHPLKALYSIDRGEAEIAIPCEHGELHPIHALRAGSVVGDATFADLPRGSVLRARTTLDVHVLGQQALTRLSAAMQPFEQAIEASVWRPKRSIFQHQPEAIRELEARRVSELATSHALIVVDATASIGAVFERLIVERGGCVLATVGGRLAGIATRSDLLAALAHGARASTPVGDAMNAKPVSVRADESAAVAAALMADGALKFLPVVDAGGVPRAVLTSDDFARIALAGPVEAPEAAEA